MSVRRIGTGRRLFVASNRPRVFVLAGSVAEARALEPMIEPASPADVARFLELHVSGRSTHEVTRDLGISRQALHVWKNRVRATLAPPPSIRQLVVERVMRGETAEEIGSALNRTRETICRIARQAGVPVKRNGYPTDAEMIALATGRTWSQLAATLNRNLRTIRAYVYARPTLAREMRAVMRRESRRSTNAESL